MNKAIETGAQVPLFDRLVDHEPHVKSEEASHFILTPERLYESIQRELELILNTRTTAKREADPDSPEILSDYKLPKFFGLQDFSWMNQASDFGRRKMARTIEDVISHFEPRLKNVTVKIEKIHKNTLSIEVHVHGDIQIETYRERVMFPMVIENIFYEESR